MRKRLTTTGIGSALLCLGIGPGAALAQGIPSPESVLGFEPGADYRLASYEESVDYFKRLDAASENLRLVEVGRTSEGRTWYLAIISSVANLGALERHRDAAQRLARASISEEEARALARSTPVFVDISGGLHASEVAGAQHTIKLAYELLRRASEEPVRRMLDSVVLFLWPSLNPDGQDIVVNWYRENVGGPYEAAPLYELYQKYIGHDNNRDGYMLNVIESRVLARTWRYWEPQIIYVHHQSSPFPTRIWLPPFAEPIAPRSPARIVREINAIGMHIAQELETRGMPGATHAGSGFDAWYPGYVDYLPVLQHIAAFWTETALYRYATPYFYTLEDFPQSYRDFRPQNLYVSPWKGGWWRLADAVNYMLVASEAVLDYARKNRYALLWNRYRSARETIERYRSEPPYAYIVPREQRDPMAAVELLRRLAFHGVDLYELSRAAEHDGERYAAGTWVIPMDQAFAELVRQLLEVQVYPDLREFPGGPPEQPYDAAGWTLPYQMDVRVVEARVPLEEDFRAALVPVRADPRAEPNDPATPFELHPVAAGIVGPPGGLSGSGPLVSVDPRQTYGFKLIGRALARGGSVRFDPQRGSYLIGGIGAAEAERWARELGVRAERSGIRPGPQAAARVAIYKPWRPSMDEGWTRWLFDQYGYPYTTITNADFPAGGLESRFDVIVLPSESVDLLLNGYAKGSVPPRYEGGIGAAGVRALDAFVRAGGTLVCLNRSSDFAIEQLGLPVRNVVRDLSRSEFFSRGSIFEVVADTAHPVMAGMPARAKVFFDQSPVFTVEDGFEGRALAKYPEERSPLLSGYLLGDRHLRGYAAALEVVHGRGRVILLGFRPQWRGQPMGTFRVLFNAVLYGGELAGAGLGSDGFWTAPRKGGVEGEVQGR
ncbi:MAG: peptidase [Gemmatimonadales bacterium]|nr:MAG: peptidase [Gemmatimonadales bacterium]